MKCLSKILSSIICAIIILIIGSQQVIAQYTMPEEMDTATLKEQMNYIHEKTRIYNDFRAIREDIFQKMKTNSLDSLVKAKKEISELQSLLKKREIEIISLNSNLESTGQKLNEAVKNKNALTFLGIQMDKKFYNTIMWIIVAALAALLTILFIIYRQNRIITVQYRDDLEETKEAFENHKKESRERYEKLVVSHHNEIMKLKGK